MFWSKRHFAWLNKVGRLGWQILWLGLTMNHLTTLPAYAQGRTFRTADAIYDPDIHTALLYSGGPTDLGLPPPVAPLGGTLLLQFDKMGDQMERFAYRIVSCNADWTVSQLNPTEYLEGFNEYFITDRQLSFNTKVSYVHYRTELPRVLLPGNYLVKVYAEGYEDQLMLTRRFVVFGNQVGIASTFGSPTGVEEAQRNQQIQFNFNYGNLQVINPLQQFKVVLRQNFRWDNAIANLQPTFVRDFERTLDYQHFNLENNFKGGNEFRLFDCRNFQARNLNVAKLELAPKMNVVFLNPDESREGWAYNPILPDKNGRFWVQNTLGRDPGTEADYVEVVFSLKTAQAAPGRVFVSGAFSEWLLTEEFELKYFEEQQTYQTVLLLKQGAYDYQYSLLRPDGRRDDVYFEGTHARTRNSYEILVYYRPPGGRTDLLVGYKLF
jgi:hypothetical protein